MHELSLVKLQQEAVVSLDLAIEGATERTLALHLTTLHHRPKQGVPPHSVRLLVPELAQDARSLLVGQQHPRARLADALQGLDGDLEVSNVEDGQLELDVACNRKFSKK